MVWIVFGADETNKFIPKYVVMRIIEYAIA